MLIGGGGRNIIFDIHRCKNMDSWIFMEGHIKVLPLSKVLSHLPSCPCLCLVNWLTCQQSNDSICGNADSTICITVHCSRSCNMHSRPRAAAGCAVILDIANMMDRIIDLQKGLIVKLFYLQLLCPLLWSCNNSQLASLNSNRWINCGFGDGIIFIVKDAFESNHCRMMMDSSATLLFNLFAWDPASVPKYFCTIQLQQCIIDDNGDIHHSCPTRFSAKWTNANSEDSWQHIPDSVKLQTKRENTIFVILFFFLSHGWWIGDIPHLPQPFVTSHWSFRGATDKFLV